MPIALRLALATATSSGFYVAAVAFAPAAAPLVMLVSLPGLILAAGASAIEYSLWFFLTAATVSAALGADGAAGFVLPFGIPALVLAHCVRQSWSFERTALAGILAWLLGIACLLLLAYGDPDTLVASAREQLTHSVDLALSTYGSYGASDHTLALADTERDALVTGLLDVLPALVVLSGALMIIANLVLLRRWTDRSTAVNLRLWRTPDFLIWALILAGFGMFAPVREIGLLARNIFIVVLGCYFCQGLAIVSYYLERFRLPRGIRVAGYVLIAVQHVIMAMVIALGVFDLWGNFRRLSTGSADVSLHSDGD